MESAINMVTQVLGVGLTGAIIVLGTVYAAKNLIARAVEQAGQRAIERYKSELAGVLEQQRAEAARGLEAFKAELTLGAEVRRRVAALKTETLVEIMDRADTLWRVLSNVRNDEGLDAAMGTMDSFLTLVKRRGFLFPQHANDLLRFADKVRSAATREREGSAGSHQQARDAFNDLIDIVRTELGIEDGPQLSTNLTR